MSRVYRSGPAGAPRIEWFPKADVWLDHRTKRIGIENPDDGEIAWFALGQFLGVTDALDEEMAELVEQAARG